MSGVIKNFRRQDVKVAEQIYEYRRFLEGESEEEQTFACLMKFNATTREQCWGRFYKWMHHTKPSKEEWAYYMMIFRRILNLFNTDREKRHMDDETGGVPMYVRNGKGIRGYIWLLKILSGKHALSIAKWCDKPISGYKAKQKRLYQRAADRNLEKRHKSHLREIETRARNRRKGNR